MERPLDVSPTDPLTAHASHGEHAALAAFDAAMIASLEARDHRVLRRVRPLDPTTSPAMEGTGIAVGLDLETTGLDPLKDEIVEVALVRVRYDLRSGRLLGTEGVFSALREPNTPLPAAVSRLTKIHPEDLAGRAIDPRDVTSFMQGVRLVCAHNASFDRCFAEAAWPIFATLPWACSCTGVDWGELGFEGARLSHLVMQSGHFHDGHRAADDVFAMLHCLQLEVPSSGSPMFLSLLENARTATARVWAESAPYAKKDDLKTRGFRWSAGERGAPRAWYRDVPHADVADEIDFLRDAIFDNTFLEPRIVPITAFDRFSDRAGAPASCGVAS